MYLAETDILNLHFWRVKPAKFSFSFKTEELQWYECKMSHVVAACVYQALITWQIESTIHMKSWKEKMYKQKLSYVKWLTANKSVQTQVFYFFLAIKREKASSIL